jgi:hypothetical protein
MEPKSPENRIILRILGEFPFKSTIKNIYPFRELIFVASSSYSCLYPSAVSIGRNSTHGGDDVEGGEKFIRGEHLFLPKAGAN